MNALEFYGSKVEEDANGLIDGFQKVLEITRVSSFENVKVVAYQLKDVSQIWYDQWKDNIALRAVLLEWETIKSKYIDRFFPWEFRE